MTGQRVRDRISNPDAFIVEFDGTITFSQVIDIVAWYEGFTEAGQKDYIRFGTENDEGYAFWEMPFVYATNTLWHNVEVDGGFAFGPAVDAMRVDVDNIDDRIVKRPGAPAYAKPRTTPEDCAALLERVPWLKNAHRVFEGLDEELTEEDLADLARIPGINDDPLFDPTGSNFT